LVNVPVDSGTILDPGCWIRDKNKSYRFIPHPVSSIRAEIHNSMGGGIIFCPDVGRISG